MARHKNKDWVLPEGDSLDFDLVPLALLMDIRDELKKLNLENLNITNLLHQIYIKLPTQKKRKKQQPKKAKETVK